jgi:hypothetical protein
MSATMTILRKSILGSAVFLLSLALVLPYAFRDPDPHHDGYQYGAALALAQGHFVHSEVFNQYGPITAWLQGLVLWIWGPELLNIRIFTAIQIALIALLMFGILRHFMVKSQLAFLLAISWVITSPDWSVYPGTFPLWPWPSVLFQLFLLSSLLLFLKSFTLNQRKQGALLFLSGTLVGLSGFTRLQNGALLYLVMNLGIFLLFRSRQELIKKIYTFNVGVLLSGMIVLMSLLLNGALDDFIKQAVLGAADRYGGNLIDPIYLLLYYIIPTLLFGLPLALIGMCLTMKTKKLKTIALVTSFVWITVAFGLLVLRPSFFSAILTKYDVLRSAFDVGPMFLSITASVAIILIILFSLVSVLISRFDSYKNRTMQADDDSYNYSLVLFVSLIAAVSISQIIPIHDMYHLWWASPIAIATLGIAAHNLIQDKIFVTVFALGVTTFSLIMGTTTWHLEVEQPRVYVTGGALDKMLLTQERAISDLEIRKLLTKTPPNSARFYCGDGLVSTWTGTYMSQDANFVDWAWGTNIDKDKIPAQTYICSFSVETAEVWATDNGVNISGPIHLNLSNFSNFYIFEVID